MRNYEAGSYDSESIKGCFDLNAGYTEEYNLDHADELKNVLLSMEHEAERKPMMEEDAIQKAKIITSEIKSEKCQRTIRKISSLLNSSGVTIEAPDDISSIRKDFVPDYLINENCLRLNYDSRAAICRAVSDGIFDILGLEEDKRPALMFDKSYNIEESSPEDEKNELGIFKEPGLRLSIKRNDDTLRISFLGFDNDSEFDDARLDPLAKKNGFIRINLSNFDEKTDIRMILSTLEHECFHAYQFNCSRGVMPIKTVRDKIVTAAYSYAKNQYISAKNDFEGYCDQGYESSAREFSKGLFFFTDQIIRRALKQSLEGKE